MAHPASISDEQVFAILDRLGSAGERITPNRVRTEAGGGNPSRYRTLIERWQLARSLTNGAEARDAMEGNMALVGEITRTIEIALFSRASFLDSTFRVSLARDIAGQVASNLIRGGLVNAGALAPAAPDPLEQFLNIQTGQEVGS